MLRYNSKKGALSGVIEESLRKTLDWITAENNLARETFGAVKHDKMIAEATTLSDLASKLKKMSVDPRPMRIYSSRNLAQVARAGLRGRIT